MKSFARAFFRFLKKEDGVTAVECALMLAIIVVICITALNKPQPAAVSDQPVVVVATAQK